MLKHEIGQHILSAVFLQFIKKKMSIPRQLLAKVHLFQPHLKEYLQRNKKQSPINEMQQWKTEKILNTHPLLSFPENKIQVFALDAAASFSQSIFECASIEIARTHRL